VRLASGESIARLERFLSLLTLWNTRINLVGRGDIQAIRHRHIADCLQLAPMMPAGVLRAVDLGAGAGLPGLVVAIATGAHVHLVERDQRKSAFLREAIGQIGVAATVHAKDFLVLPAVGGDVVLSRATAPFSALLDAAHRHGRNGAVMLFHKSADQAAEIETAKRRFDFRLQRIPSRSDPRGEIWRVSGLFGREG
jgi:16S rRNA (guanine527-N7)-methyltransferase